MYSTVSIGPSHMESSMWFSQVPPQMGFPKFHNRTSPFCCLPTFSLESFKPPPNDTQYFSRSWQTSSHVIFPLQTNFLFGASVFSSTLEHLSKGICSFKKSWCPSFNRIRGFNRYINNFLFWWSPCFFILDPPSKNPPKKAHAISMAPHPPSIPWSKSRKHINPFASN